MATSGTNSTYAVDGCLMRSEICLESWCELRTIMLCSVAGCWGMLMLMAPTLTTAALFVFSPLWALYRAWDLAMLHFTTVLIERETGFIHTPFKTVTVLCYNGLLSVSQIFKYSYVILFISYIHIPFSFTLHTQMHYMPQKTTLNLRELQVMHCKNTC